MMDFQYRRMAYQIVKGQRDEVISECRHYYLTQQTDKKGLFSKRCAKEIKFVFTVFKHLIKKPGA